MAYLSIRAMVIELRHSIGLQRLSKIISQKKYFSTLTGSITTRYSVWPLLIERAEVKISRLGCVKSLRKQDFHPCTHNLNQQKYKMKASTHAGAPTSANVDKKKWNRKVTIKQSSKTNKNKILTFNISVLDTHPDEVEQERKTVVALHGFPGSGNDFESIAVKLHERGIRLVAPTSVGMIDSPMTIDQLGEIDFSIDGRTRSVQLILQEMNINRVDMIVAHSAGAWTMYRAGATWNNIGSLLGINPAGAKPNRTLRPLWFLRFIASALHWSLGRFIIMPFIAKVYNLIGFRDVTQNGNGTHLIASMQYISNQEFSDVPLDAQAIRKKRLPIIFAYAVNDKIVESNIFFDMAYNVMGISAQNTVTYTDDKTPNRDPFFVPEGWLTRCLVFSRGGHVVHLAHAQEIAEQIEDALKYAFTGKKTHC